VGISTFKAGLKPEDKLSYVRQAAAEAAGSSSSSSKEGDEQVSVSHVAAATGGAAPNGLLMAGDGINDAPALAAAQVKKRESVVGRGVGWLLVCKSCISAATNCWAFNQSRRLEGTGGCVGSLARSHGCKGACSCAQPAACATSLFVK